MHGNNLKDCAVHSLAFILKGNIEGILYMKLFYLTNVFASVIKQAAHGHEKCCCSGVNVMAATFYFHSRRPSGQFLRG